MRAVKAPGRAGAAAPAGVRTARFTKAAAKPTAASGPGAARHSVAPLKGSRSEAEATFDRLRMYEKNDASNDCFGAKGLQQLFTEVNVASGSFEMYVLLWRLGAIRHEQVTRSEWLVSMYANNTEQLTQLRAKLPEWVQEIKANRHDAFPEMYNFLYDYIRGESDRQMSVAHAASVWPTLIPVTDAKLVGHWVQWVVTEYARPISRDLWRQAWLYLSGVAGVPCAELVHDNGKWPTAVDDFAIWRLEAIKREETGVPH